MRVLVLFLDGIGLGDDDPTINPFAVMNTPTLHALAGGQRWLRSTPRTESERAIFLPTDATMGVPGRPQSGSGQATIITGLNIPQMTGEHYGPRPSLAIRQILDQQNLPKTLVEHGKRIQLLNPYPPVFHEAVARGKRLPDSIQYSFRVAGIPILTEQHYYRGEAIAPDWVGEGWRQFLGYQDAPTYTPTEAGYLLAKLARANDFSFFSTWLTDEIGHRGPFEDGVRFMERFDAAMAGLLEVWDDDEGIIIITSDHGNMEVQGDRRHSLNPVPTVVIGSKRHEFARDFLDLSHITPGILRVMGLLETS